MVSYGSCRVDKEIKLRARAEGLAVMKFFNYGQVGRGFSLDIPFHRTLIEDQAVAADRSIPDNQIFNLTQSKTFNMF